MADLTPAAFQAKWNQRFADNDTFTIDEQDLREFTADQLRTFVARAEQLGKTLVELVLPMTVVAGQWYVTTTGIWEARKDFQASAAPVAGPNWRVVLSLIPVADSIGEAQLTPALRAKLPIQLPGSTFVVVQDAGQTQPGIVGRTDRPFRTLQAAHDAAPAGSIIIVYPAAAGAAYEPATLYKSLSWFGLGMPTVTGGVLLGQYQGSSPFQMRLNGLRFGGTGFVASLKQYGGGSYALLENCEFAGENYLFVQGVGVNDATPDVIEVRNTRFSTNSAKGCIYFNQRNDYAQAQSLILDNCLLQATVADCITGNIHPNSRITLRGSDVRVRPAAGKALHSLKRVNSEVVLADEDVLTDERSGGAGDSSADLSNYYTKQQGDDRYALAGGSMAIEPLSAAQTLVARKSYLVSGSGYTLTLPAAADTPGQRLFVAVSPAATGLYPLTGSSYVLRKGETIELLATAAGWMRSSGTWQPIFTQLTNPASDSLYNDRTTDVRFSAVETDNSGGLVVAGNSLVAVRDTRYLLSYTLFLAGGIPDGTVIESKLYAGNVVYKGYAVIDQGSGTAALTKPVALQAGQSISLAAYCYSGALASGQKLGETVPAQCFLSLTENFQ